jgi:hypothetical protein
MHIIGRDYPIWLNHHSHLIAASYALSSMLSVASVADPHRAHSYTEWLTCRAELSVQLAQNSFLSQHT